MRVVDLKGALDVQSALFFCEEGKSIWRAPSQASQTACLGALREAVSNALTLLPLVRQHVVSVRATRRK
jgi:hypothetical protein